MRLLAAALLIATFTVPATAQIQPQPSSGDPHLQQVDYDAFQIVTLRGSPGFELMIEFSPDERVKNVAVGDSAGWQASVNHDGNRLFLKPTQPGITTNMTVVTSVRLYSFELISMEAPSADMPYTVEFRYPLPAPDPTDASYVDVSTISRRLSHYRLSGDRTLWPSSISDDGSHVFIAWPHNAAIPAIYATDGSRGEVLVNGMMGTDDVYVVDGTPQKLTFRIDRSVACAMRIIGRKAH